MLLTLLVGPPGSGKSTFAKKGPTYIYVNQDLQGKEGHMEMFKIALETKHPIIIDRMNFSKEQRDRYLVPAKELGYETQIIVLHENYETCLKRCLDRKDHPTIKNEQDARKALDFFFKKYERVEDSEANKVVRQYNDNYKSSAIICDLDGTLCNIDHRLHHVKGEKKNWKFFFEDLKNDSINNFCLDILLKFSYDYSNIVFCSGRPFDHFKETKNWLDQYIVNYNLYMRPKGDFRRDDIVKENLLDFEILTRFTPYFILDDRDQVVKMWRKRGYTCLQVAEGNF